jgi:hypothetical protein
MTMTNVTNPLIPNASTKSVQAYSLKMYLTSQHTNDAHQVEVLQNVVGYYPLQFQRHRPNENVPSSPGLFLK